ncbi:hypothetical protein ABE10_25420 [Bacillus toyonensis]|nr:hypothetical protein [Bacillus toyonensis]
MAPEGGVHLLDRRESGGARDLLLGPPVPAGVDAEDGLRGHDAPRFDGAARGLLGVRIHAAKVTDGEVELLSEGRDVEVGVRVPVLDHLGRALDDGGLVGREPCRLPSRVEERGHDHAGERFEQERRAGPGLDALTRAEDVGHGGDQRVVLGLEGDDLRIVGREAVLPYRRRAQLPFAARPDAIVHGGELFVPGDEDHLPCAELHGARAELQRPRPIDPDEDTGDLRLCRSGGEGSGRGPDACHVPGVVADHLHGGPLRAVLTCSPAERCQRHRHRSRVGSAWVHRRCRFGSHTLSGQASL